MATMHGPTHLFSVRLWIERSDSQPSDSPGSDEEEPCVRGRVEHVLSRQVRYVCSLEELAAYLMAKLEKQEANMSE